MPLAQKIPANQLRVRPLSNITCPYCGAAIGRKERTKEHVVGRRFVPVGSLSDCWNLILWACHSCNGKKSDLEDDISAITMTFHTASLPLMSNSLMQAEAQRKSTKSVSRKTGKPVAESSESTKVHAKVGAFAEITANLTAPPQLDDARVYELARLQMIGFFYFLTYDRIKNVGHYWPGGFYPVHGAIKSDWGNPVHRAFMNEVVTWDYRLVLSTAGGYYRAVIRRHPTSDCWSWAVEWNDCYRLVGFFGDLGAAKEVAGRLPDNPVRSVFESPTRWLRYRIDEPLNEDDDLLFHVPPESDAQPFVAGDLAHKAAQGT